MLSGRCGPTIRTQMSQSLVPSATGDASEGRAALWRTGPRRRARGRSVKNLGSNWVMFESESPRSCPIVTPTSGLMKRSAMVVYGSPIVGLQSITDPRMVAGLATTPGAAIVPWTEAAPDALEVEYEVLGNGDDSDAEGQGPACTAIVPVPSAIPAAPVRRPRAAASCDCHRRGNTLVQAPSLRATWSMRSRHATPAGPPEGTGR